MLHKAVLLGLDCTSQEELELVVDQQVIVAVVYQFSSHPMVSVTLRVVGYQYGSTDGVKENVNDLNSIYLDGVSITCGSPRKHVWTLYAGVSSDYNDYGNACPCAGGTSAQAFVGNNYFCESGTPSRYLSRILYISDPLWDGHGCHGLENSCCSVSGLPWFHRDYGTTTTTDYLELRVCGDEGTIVNNAYSEDAPVSLYEIYVK